MKASLKQRSSSAFGNLRLISIPTQRGPFFVDDAELFDVRSRSAPLRGVMPIYRLLQNETTFEPEVVTLMGEVFEDALRSLGLVDRTVPLAELIAKTVIELAQYGERDPVRLKARTLQAIAVKPSAMLTPEEYRRFAELCNEAAKTVDDEIERMMLLRVADQWGRLATYKATKSAQAARKANIFTLSTALLDSREDVSVG
jgi:hypothetical protein